jgi:protein-L-isoaspartate(D-aspartate) O-methyltransferase
MTSQRTRERLVTRLSERGITSLTVLDVMGRTPRHIFVDEALAHRAYEDSALPIGYNQTISQPYIVARMTELILAHGKPKKILEVGTGSGYQTAILAQVSSLVYSVERIKPLQEKAKQRLKELGFRNVQLRHADGGFGWAQVGPFDAIISAAAPSEIPPQLLEQLAPAGVLVIPVGATTDQRLTVVKRIGNTEDFVTQVIEEVHFVPLVAGIER